MSVQIITHKQKIPIISNNRIAKLGNDLYIGYDNITPSPYTNTNYLILVKYRFTSLATTSVGIKIPVNQVLYGPIGNTTTNDFSIFDISVNSTPNWTSGGGVSGFSRTSWVLTSDANYIYAYTNDATQKSGLSTTKDYWIGFLTKASDGGFARFIVNEYSSKEINTQLRPYVFGVVGVIDRYTNITVLDYNA